MAVSFDEMFDVVVVGAGFGGSVAARRCAEAGLKTLLLESAEVPGENDNGFRSSFFDPR